MTFEKHLRSVSRAAFQRLCILNKSRRVFIYRLLLERWCRGFVPPFLSIVLLCGARLLIHALSYRVVSGPTFLTYGVLECNILHRRSVAKSCLLYKIGCNPMNHPHMVLYMCRMCYSAGWTRYFDRSTICLCTFSLQSLTVPYDFYSSIMIFIWNYLGDPVFNCVGLRVFQSRADASLTT